LLFPSSKSVSKTKLKKRVRVFSFASFHTSPSFCVFNEISF
jgi:hypothetical protein